ncbi:MAG: CHASE2 domain-containing protein [Verrucomicrobia bacterium]|nr:CHASE2 domain-containing protein [Verrucomicrobiota bacterium]
MPIPRLLALLAAASLGLLVATALVPCSRFLLPCTSAPPKTAELPILITIADLAGEPWPWPRLDLTLVLRALSPYRPNPVGLLLPLDAPDVLEPVQDNQMARALSSFDPPVLPAAAFPPLAETEKLPLPKLPHQGSIHNLRTADYFLAPDTNLRRAATIAAWKVTPEADGQLRRLPLVFRQEDEVVPSWLLVMYARALGADLSRSELQGRRLILRDDQGLQLQTIPLDLRGSVPVDWDQPDPASIKMEIRGVVLAAEQDRIGLHPYYDLKTLSRKPVIIASTIPEVDPAIDSPLGKRALAEAVLRTWSRLSTGPQPVLHPPSWLILLVLFTSAGLGLSSGNRWGIGALEALGFAGLVFGMGWVAAQLWGYSGALPLAVGSIIATLLAPRLFQWMEVSHVR